MTLAISKAVEEGAKAVVCASTGNTSASRRRLRGEGGAHVRRARAERARSRSARWRRPSCTAPGCWRWRATSTRRSTLARDLADALPGHAREQREPVPARGAEDGRVRDLRRARAGPRHPLRARSATPATSRATGSATRSTSLDGVIAEPPQLFGFQAAGAAPHRARRTGRGPADDRDGDPDREPGLVGQGGRRRARVRGRDLRPSPTARSSPPIAGVAREGLFVEPASAASVAGLLQLHAEGRLPAGATVVCILTGHGLKDPEWAIAGAAPPVTVPADADAVAARARSVARTAIRSALRCASRSASRPPRRTSAPGSTASGWRSSSATRSWSTRRPRRASTWEGEGADELPTDGSI